MNNSTKIVSNDRTDTILYGNDDTKLTRILKFYELVYLIDTIIYNMILYILFMKVIIRK